MATTTTKNSDDKVTLITRDGLKKLQKEFKQLTEVRRKEIAGRIKEAISYGDLSENSEYEEAKNEQAFVEGRILELEALIKSAKIISEKHTTHKTVQMGARVVIENLTTHGAPEEYMIVGSTEADPFEHRISNESPIGKALLEKKEKEEVVVETPSGKVKYRIKKLH